MKKVIILVALAVLAFIGVYFSDLKWEYLELIPKVALAAIVVSLLLYVFSLSLWLVYVTDKKIDLNKTMIALNKENSDLLFKNKKLESKVNTLELTHASLQRRLDLYIKAEDKQIKIQQVVKVLSTNRTRKVYAIKFDKELLYQLSKGGKWYKSDEIRKVDTIEKEVIT